MSFDSSTEGTTKKKSSGIYCVLVFALLFLAWFIPIYESYLRSFISRWGNYLWDMIGTFCLLFGGIMVVYGILGLFARWSNCTRRLFLGILLLWIGCWITGAILPILDLLPGISRPDAGYY